MTWRSLQHLALGLVLVAQSFLAIPLAQASVLTSATMQLSTHATSTLADHTFEFVTASGVDSSSDTIVIEYASGFSLGSVAFGDVDLAEDDDGACDGPWTDKTLAASAASGVWGASASGQVLTLTAPTDAASGEITGLHCVQIQIGTNADSGSNQITNPGSSGSYEVDVYGAFGDQAIYAVGISGASSGLTVTGIVGSAEDPPEEPVVPTPNNPPVISNVLVSSITDSSAVITWTTDEPATRVLSYGETTSYELGAIANTALRTSHTQSLSGLSDGTEHHFQIYVEDSLGAGTTSIDYTFTTLDVTAPTLVLTVDEITETTAEINWTTDEPTSSVLDVSTVSIFTDTNLVTANVQALVGLAPATTYTVILDVTDASGNTTSQTTTFTTLVDLPPANVTNLSAVAGDGLVTLTWDNPTDADFSNVLLVFRTDTFASIPSQGTLIYSSDGESFVHTGLTNGQEYFYTIFTVDLAGNISSGATDSAIPVATAPEPDPEEDDDEDDGEEEDDSGEEEDDDEEDAEEEDDDTEEDEDEDEDAEDDESEDDTEEDGDEDEVLPPEPDVLIPLSEITFLVARDSIVLTPRGDNVRVLAARPLAVELNLINAPAEVTSVQLELPDGSYLMNPATSLVSSSSSTLVAIENETLYTARVITPSSGGVMTIRINYVTGEAQVMSYQLDVRGDGTIVSDSTGDRLSDVGVSLYQRIGDWQLWNGAPYAQANPVTSNGTYAWYVPNGTYRVEAVKDSYSTVRTVGLSISDNIVNVPIEMIELLPPIDEMIEDGVPTLSAVTQQVQQSIKIFRQDPTVQDAASIATPIIAVSAVSTAAVVVTTLNGIRFLQYLFTAPFLLFRRRRRKRWGVAYDSLRKVPVDLAIVRLLDAQTKRVVKSQVTDKKGRYLFIAKPGLYTIDVRKDGFTFPSGHLKDQKRDGEYLDLYHGEPIVVKEQDAVIAANIPLDPAGESVKTPTSIRWERLTRRFMHVLSIAGVVVAIVVAFVQPTAWTIVVAVVQVLVLILFLRMAIPNKPKSWGIVYDHKTRRPLANAIVRIFDPKYNKLLETQITDGRGRYAFLVGPNQYYTTYEKGGYTKLEVRPIDRTDTKEASYVSVDVGLNRKGKK